MSFEFRRFSSWSYNFGKTLVLVLLGLTSAQNLHFILLLDLCFWPFLFLNFYFFHKQVTFCSFSLQRWLVVTSSFL